MAKTIADILCYPAIDKLDLKVLLRHVLKLSDVALVTKADYCLTELEYSQLEQLLAKRQQGVPVAYLVGYKEFYSRNFKVNQHTLIPRPETELLVDKVIALAKDGDNLLELGTGSGCIAISCKLEHTSLKITATDISDEALQVASLNAQVLGAEIEFVHGNWYDNLAIDKTFDLVVSNPPYIAIDDAHLINLNYEPKTALTDFASGIGCIEHIIAGARQHLSPGGILLLEHGYAQGLQVRELMHRHGFSQIMTYCDYALLERVTIGYTLCL